MHLRLSARCDFLLKSLRMGSPKESQALLQHPLELAK